MFNYETRLEPVSTTNPCKRWVVYEDGRKWHSWTYSSKSSAMRAIKRAKERAVNYRCSCCREKLLELEAAGGLCPINARGNCGLRNHHPERRHPDLLTIGCMNTLSSSHWYVENEQGQDCEVVHQAIPVIRKALVMAYALGRQDEDATVKGALA